LLVAGISAVLAIAFMKVHALPVINQTDSVRTFYRKNAQWLDGACLQDVNRAAEYGLSFYAGHTFPECPAGQASPKVMGVGKELILLD
jgi:hypothetical protein